MDKALKIKGNIAIAVLNSVLECCLIQAGYDNVEDEQINVTPHQGYYYVTAADSVDLQALLNSVCIVPDRLTPLDQQFVEKFMNGTAYGLTNSSEMTVEIIPSSELPPTHVHKPRIVDMDMLRFKVTVPPQPYDTTKTITEAREKKTREKEKQPQRPTSPPMSTGCAPRVLHRQLPPAPRLRLQDPVPQAAPGGLPRGQV